MIAVTTVRAQNLRCLADSGQIDLKPITILVGRNSSGKSTFARIFPMLRQSSEVTKRGPILWWGRLVDFGSFNEAVNRNAGDKKIGLDFRLTFDANDIRSSTRSGFGGLSTRRNLGGGEISVSLQFRQGESGSYTSNIALSVYDFQCNLSLDESGMVSSIESGSYSWKPSGQIACYAAQDRLIPIPHFFKAIDVQGVGVWESFDPFYSELSKSIRAFVNGNTSDERVRQLANKIPFGPRDEIFKLLLLTQNPPTFRRTLRQQGLDSQRFRRLCDLSFVSQLDVLIEQVGNGLATFSRDIIYLEPLRATAQRYYRQQALAVGEIDSKGENIAMFLDSLSEFQLDNFKGWTSQHFGIQIAPKKEGGHISLTVKQSAEGAEANIADMGFGFSQMLPIAAQLWAASAHGSVFPRARQRSLQPLIVIEQPELHLHPEYQAKLADVFVAAVSDKISDSEIVNSPSSRLRIIAETHSSALINQLGTLIANKVIDSDKIQVLLFEQEDSKSSSTLTRAEFDQEGILRNWPIGFFEPMTTN